MKNIIHEIGKQLIDFFTTFGVFILAGVVGSIAYSIHTGTSVRRLLLKIPISAIIGISTGILLQEYTNASMKTTTVVCSVFGAFTHDVLNIIEKLLQWIPDAIKSVVSKKLDIDNKPPKTKNK